MRERLRCWQDDWALDGFWHGPNDYTVADASSSFARPSMGGFLPPSLEYTPASPPKVLVLVQPAPNLTSQLAQSHDPLALRHDQLVQKLKGTDMDLLWRSMAPPVFPDLGPLYSFRDGYYRFRYGTSAAKILTKEVQYTQEPEDKEPSDPSEDEGGRDGGESLELTLRTLSVEAEEDEDQELEERDQSDDDEDEVEVDIILDEEEEIEDEDEIEDELSSEPQSTITDEPSVM